MACTGQMVVIYLHKQDVESFYLGICTQNEQTADLPTWFED
jgi:hypothetical protein